MIFYKSAHSLLVFHLRLVLHYIRVNSKMEDPKKPFKTLEYGLITIKLL